MLENIRVPRDFSGLGCCRRNARWIVHPRSSGRDMMRLNQDSSDPEFALSTLDVDVRCLTSMIHCFAEESQSSALHACWYQFRCSERASTPASRVSGFRYKGQKLEGCHACIASNESNQLCRGCSKSEGGKRRIYLLACGEQFGDEGQHRSHNLRRP